MIGVERLFFTKNVQTAFAVGQARGVVCWPPRSTIWSPRGHAQRGQGGHGRPRLRRQGAGPAHGPGDPRLAEMPEPDDAADALAIAICVANRERSVSRIPDRRAGSVRRSRLRRAA
jgi:crossover junction endodeoxyribonuclease RuvC